MAKRSFVFAVLSLIAAAVALPAQTSNKAQSVGALDGGVYRDATGVQFTLPPDWVIISHAPASDGAHTVVLRDTITNVIATVWLKARMSIQPTSWR
jgi:hypothetical protein